LALEFGHFAFVPAAFLHIGAIQEEGQRKGEKDKADEKRVIQSLERIYEVQWWRMWVVNVPCWALCWLPFL